MPYCCTVAKTKKKIAAKLPHLIPQPNGGALLSGGVPGHDGSNAGRPSLAFLDLCRKNANDETLWAEAREKNPVAVLALSAEFTEPKPAQQHKVDATVKFMAVRE